MKNLKNKSEGKNSHYPLKEVGQAIAATILVLVAVAAFLLNQISSGYKATIDSKNATIEKLDTEIKIYKNRLIVKDDQLSELRKRLGIIEENQTSYSVLTNKELKNKALDIVKKLREALIKYRNKSDVLLYSDLSRKNWNEYNKKTSQISRDLRNEYSINYKIEAILLKDEILSRLSPKLKRNRDKYLDSNYENPVNPIGMGEIVDDLERISKILLD